MSENAELLSTNIIGRKYEYEVVDGKHYIIRKYTEVSRVRVPVQVAVVETQMVKTIAKRKRIDSQPVVKQVEEAYTTFEKVPCKKIVTRQVEKEVEEPYTEHVKVTRMRQVEVPTTVEKEVQEEEEYTTLVPRQEKRQGYRIDTVVDVRLAEVTEDEIVEYVPVQTSEEVSAVRDLGHKGHVSRHLGDTLYWNDDVQDVEYDSDDNAPLVPPSKFYRTPEEAGIAPDYTCEAFSPTNQSGQQVSFADFNLRDEKVVIVNSGPSAVDLTGWKVGCQSGDQQFSFPNGFSLAGQGGHVTIVSGRGTKKLADGLNVLHWANKSMWSSSGDMALLISPSGATVDSIDGEVPETPARRKRS